MRTAQPGLMPRRMTRGSGCAACARSFGPSQASEQQAVCLEVRGNPCDEVASHRSGRDRGRARHKRGTIASRLGGLGGGAACVGRSYPCAHAHSDASRVPKCPTRNKMLLGTFFAPSRTRCCVLRFTGVPAASPATPSARSRKGDALPLHLCPPSVDGRPA